MPLGCRAPAAFPAGSSDAVSSLLPSAFPLSRSVRRVSDERLDSL